MLTLALALTVATMADAAPAAEAIARGHAFYARRAEGQKDGVARTEWVDRAIAEYREALVLDPASYEARLGLLRAFFFRGGFCGLSDKEQVTIADEAKKLADDTVKRLDVDLQRRKGKVKLEAAKEIETSAEIYLWSAVAWGQWAVSHKVSAAFQGAPGRIRDLATAVMQIDPRTEQAGAVAVLGRLHRECPKVIFITGWISRTEGLRLLRESLSLAPENPANAYFLAEALLKENPRDAVAARKLLEKIVGAVPRPAYLVEDQHYAAQARELLAAVP